MQVLQSAATSGCGMALVPTCTLLLMLPSTHREFCKVDDLAVVIPHVLQKADAWAYVASFDTDNDQMLEPAEVQALVEATAGVT